MIASGHSQTERLVEQVRQIRGRAQDARRTELYTASHSFVAFCITWAPANVITITLFCQKNKNIIFNNNTIEIHLAGRQKNIKFIKLGAQLSR